MQHIGERHNLLRKRNARCNSKHEEDQKCSHSFSCEGNTVGDNRPDGGVGRSSDWKQATVNVRRHIDPRIEPGARVSRRQWVKSETSSQGVVGVGPSAG